MQAAVEDVLMPTTCTIMRAGTATPNQKGGFTGSFTAYASGVPCRVGPISSLGDRTPAESMFEERIGSQQRYMVYMPAGQSVQLNDRIVVADGRTFEVVSVPVESFQMWQPVVCVQVT